MYVLHTIIYIYLYVHVHTRSCWNVFVCSRYRHVCTCYRHVCTYVHCTDMSVHGTDMSVPFCQILSRWSGFQMSGHVLISGVCNIVPDIGFNIEIYQYWDIMSRYRVLARFQMYLLEPHLSQVQMWTFHFAPNAATFSIGGRCFKFGNGLISRKA